MDDLSTENFFKISRSGPICAVPNRGGRFMVLPLTVSHERSRAALKLARHRRVRLEEGVSKLMSRMMWTGGHRRRAAHVHTRHEGALVAVVFQVGEAGRPGKPRRNLLDQQPDGRRGEHAV